MCVAWSNTMNFFWRGWHGLVWNGYNATHVEWWTFSCPWASSHEYDGLCMVACEIIWPILTISRSRWSFSINLTSLCLQFMLDKKTVLIKHILFHFFVLTCLLTWKVAQKLCHQINHSSNYPVWFLNLIRRKMRVMLWLILRFMRKTSGKQ